jgi:hypothetical protein
MAQVPLASIATVPPATPEPLAAAGGRGGVGKIRKIFFFLQTSNLIDFSKIAKNRGKID